MSDTLDVFTERCCDCGQRGTTQPQPAVGWFAILAPSAWPSVSGARELTCERCEAERCPDGERLAAILAPKLKRETWFTCYDECQVRLVLDDHDEIRLDVVTDASAALEDLSCLTPIHATLAEPDGRAIAFGGLSRDERSRLQGALEDAWRDEREVFRRDNPLIPESE